VRGNQRKRTDEESEETVGDIGDAKKNEERRRWKNVNSEVGKKLYRKLNNELRRKTDAARKQY
jgi:hypothetical protein